MSFTTSYMIAFAYPVTVLLDPKAMAIFIFPL